MRTSAVSSLLLTYIWICGTVLGQVPQGFIRSFSEEDNFAKDLSGAVNAGSLGYISTINGGTNYFDISAEATNNKGVAKDSAFSGASITLNNIQGFGSNITSSFSTFAEGNIARSKEDVAFAGTSIAFVDLNNIPFNTTSTAVQNRAIAGDLAVSGIVSSMGDLSESGDDLRFELSNNASDNVARSKQGVAISGVTTQSAQPGPDYVPSQSTFTSDDTSTNNIATANLYANAGMYECMYAQCEIRDAKHEIQIQTFFIIINFSSKKMRMTNFKQSPQILQKIIALQWCAEWKHKILWVFLNEQPFPLIQ
eukprot:TRINITY_DN4286_c0_g1_i2.p1 TRINITY_DN4286_c0_g1~~TRINITY_DN4286_c0_g1_i2.p1  ORF type:complete len:309 (+),score=36.83 TRINITY_DN4286_c0_g1_i2:109-1035(+)